MMFMAKIRLFKVRQHNLKGFDLEIPREAVVVICGPSGSGKSSLAVDVLYAEGRRRYLEALGLSREAEFRELEPPDMESAEGIPAPVVVTQGVPSGGRRSTVGTISGLYDLLRHIFVWAGTARCLTCGQDLLRMTIDEMVAEVLRLPSGTKLEILAPLKVQGDLKTLARGLLREGYPRIRVGEELYDLSEELPSDLKTREFRVIIDRLVIKEGVKTRLAESLRLSLEISQGFVEILPLNKRPLYLSSRWTCPRCLSPFPEVLPALFSFNQAYGACPRCKGLGLEGQDVCPLCQGRRLSPAALSVYLGSKNIIQWTSLPLSTLVESLSKTLPEIKGEVRREVTRRLIQVLDRRLAPFVAVGLGYLSLLRPLDQLSRGELGRLKLASALGEQLAGALFILDEPTVGLSSKEQATLLELIKSLKASGNTIVVVEHEPSFIEAADWVIELGPGAGDQGGELLYSGPPQGLKDHPGSPTGKILRDGLLLPPLPRSASKQSLSFSGVIHRNLKRLSVELPMGALTAVVGPSGAGKTALLEAIAESLKTGNYLGPPGLKGILVDQALKDVSRSSLPVTYIGAFDEIRRLFAHLPEARMRGYRPGHFSLSVKGGRCEACKGLGYQEVALAFMPPVRLVCSVCQGRRFSGEILEVRYRGLSIAEVLDLSATQAVSFFARVPAICEKVRLLERVGLGYLRLGQPLNTLSGGERQRLKLARYLKEAKPEQVLLLDEPSAGLHPQDLIPLLKVFGELLEAGTTLVLAEHDQFLIDQAHYIIELGPGAGEQGGKLLKVQSSSI